MNEPQDRFIQAGDLRLHVREWGASSRPLLVLLHGLASTCHMFDLIAPVLAADYFVVAPDQRGHGLSAKPSSGYDFETISADLDHLLDAYQADTVILFGHSWGAYTTLYYAATRPKRVGKAGLIDGGIRLFSDLFPTWAEAEINMSPPTFVHQTTADIERMIEFDWLGSLFRPELLPLARSVFDTSDPNNVHAHLSRESHMQIAHAIWSMRPTEYFARVRCPILIVHAIAPGQSEDAPMQAYLRDAQSAMPQAQIVAMPDTTHDIPWHRPQELVAVIEPFLRA